MKLESQLKLIHSELERNNIPHALIGAFAMAGHGVHRATNDIDFLIEESTKVKVKELLVALGFEVFFESSEVLQFTGAGNIDFLFAQRPLTLEMLKHAGSKKVLGIDCVNAEDLIGLKIQAYKNSPKREFQDKADIQHLIENNPNLDWDVVKKYADLFQEWPVIAEIKDRAEG